MKRLFSVKIIYLFILSMLFSFASVSAFAADIKDLEEGEVVGFKITAGLGNKKDREYETTFDEYREVTGTAPEDTVITIIVSKTVEASGNETDKEETISKDTGEGVKENNEVEIVPENLTDSSSAQGNLEASEDAVALNEGGETSSNETATGDSGSKDEIEFEASKEYTIEVSKLKVFSQDIEFTDGWNYISITAVKYDVYQTYEFIINKKSQEIKEELEKGIRIIPIDIVEAE